MGRAVGAFLVLFSLLSLLVHLTAMFEYLGVAAILFLACDAAIARISRSSASRRFNGEVVL